MTCIAGYLWAQMRMYELHYKLDSKALMHTN